MTTQHRTPATAGVFPYTRPSLYTYNGIMARERIPGSRSQVITVRVSAETAQAVDAARGPASRSAWIEGLISAELSQPVIVCSACGSAACADGTLLCEDARKAGHGHPSGLIEGSGRRGESRDLCPHPRARVIKGFCYRCGSMVLK